MSVLKITDVRVDWMEEYSNDPRWVIETDHAVHGPLVYRHYGPSLYVAETECGFANFYSYTAPDRGYGGRSFDLTMANGTQKTLKGPWSSRAGAVNAYTPHRLVDCVWEPKGGYHYSAAFTMISVLEWLVNNKPSQGAALVRWHGDLMLLPLREDGTLKNKEDSYTIIGRADMSNDVCLALWCDMHDIQQHIIEMER